MKHWDDEELFHSHDRKQFRKERKIAQKTDRSKFKKTDLFKNSEDTAHHLLRGRVVSISGEGAFVDFEGSPVLCSLKGLMKKDTSQVKNLIAVGDWVRCSEEKVIVQVEPRTSVLGRTDISGRKEQLMAVNVDQVIIAVSIVNPPLKPALVDRYLIAAEKGNIHPVIAINKIDLLPKASQEERDRYKEFLAAYIPLGLPIFSVSAASKVGLEALRSLLHNKTSVFSGQSGVGKSSLLNACFGFDLKVGDLAIKTAKGSHTTTSAELILLPCGGYCVDTPGIRSFGIWDLTKPDVIAHFHDFFPFAKKCKYPDCMHIQEPGCKVLHALEKGSIAPLRYESYVNLLEEISGGSQSKTWSG
ncbi:MAG TPA: ribosome small subunit-dependent GTPase A [Chlamydiales bacterium]|nr:ribosome small subunit-dependent GTPase A [Chlamydiales bacterium]